MRWTRPNGSGTSPPEAGRRLKAALERYVAEVRAADAAYRDWKLADLSGRHLDMLARTAAEQHRIAEVEALSRHARALREPRD